MIRPSISHLHRRHEPFRPNLDGLKKDLARRQNSVPTVAPWPRLTRLRLGRRCPRARPGLPPDERICGAEINSIASMIDKATSPPTAVCSSSLRHRRRPTHCRHPHALLPGEADTRRSRPSTCRPARPRPQALPHQRPANLARKICCRGPRTFRAACAINATGGYKAQIAIAVLLGQALGVPVYYKHELFSEIIAFPPMPIALDFEVWMRASGMLYDLERNSEPIPAALYADDWDEKYESLVDRDPHRRPGLSGAFRRPARSSTRLFASDSAPPVTRSCRRPCRPVRSARTPGESRLAGRTPRSRAIHEQSYRRSAPGQPLRYVLLQPRPPRAHPLPIRQRRHRGDPFRRPIYGQVSGRDLRPDTGPGGCRRCRPQRVACRSRVMPTTSRGHDDSQCRAWFRH